MGQKGVLFVKVVSGTKEEKNIEADQNDCHRENGGKTLGWGP